jgi:hypothetical protein
MKKSKLALREGDFEGALRWADSAVSRAPAHLFPPYFIRAEANMRLSRFREVEWDIKHISSLIDDHSTGEGRSFLISLRVLRVRLHVAREEIDQAIAELEKGQWPASILKREKQELVRRIEFESMLQAKPALVAWARGAANELKTSP